MSKTNRRLGDIDTSALANFAADNFPKTQPSKEKSRKEKSARDVTITLRIPTRIAKDLRIKAATADKTQRELILEGLKKMGIDVKDEDIADRRKG